MIDAAHAVPITRQAELLELSRASVYYLPRATPASDLALMRRIDELHLNHLFAGTDPDLPFRVVRVPLDPSVFED